MRVDARMVGVGAGIFGAGGLAYAAGFIYASFAVFSFGWLLMGIGGVLFAGAVLDRVPLIGVLLLAIGMGLLFFASYVLAAKRDIATGATMSLFALGWTLALLARMVYGQATATATSRNPRHQTLK